MAKKIIFINPPTPEKGVLVIRDLDRSGRKTREKIIWPQTNLAYLAAVMKKEGLEVDIIDCIASKIDWENLEKIIDSKKPDYILFNVISSTLNNDMKIAVLAHKRGIFNIAVGSHVSALPKEALDNFSNLDFLIIGEAEETLRELIQSLECKKDLSEIKGIGWRKNGKVIINEKRPLLDNLDNLPIPLHELLPIKKHNLPFIGSNFTFVMASRGCPFQCIFCRSPIAWNRVFRRRSTESILNELKYLKQIGISNILFHSDTFTLYKDWVIDLCKKIIDDKLNIKWICNSRVDTVDKEMLEWMKKAGCYMIAYGIESGSQKILDNARKGTKLEQIRSAVQNAYEVGIKVWGYFIIGLPGENKETVEETISLSKTLPLYLANFAVAAPYPGTEFYRLVTEKNWLLSSNWEDYDQNYSAIVSYPDFSNKEIEAAMKKAYKAFYFRPQTAWNLLKGIRSLNDIKVLTEVAFSHLSWMFSSKKKSC